MLQTADQDHRPADEFTEPSRGEPWWRSLQAKSTRRALLLTALGGLLIAGLITAMPGAAEDPSRLVGYIDPALAGGGNETFNSVRAGDCLNWPDNTPDAAAIVSCDQDHRFEVAEAVDMGTFPGSEYGPEAAPPSDTRIQQISQEQCQVAVRRYLGTRFDPDGRFIVSMLWSGEKAWRQYGERRMLCGLQLPGPNNQQITFAGKVAEIDQSKVWPAGTCLGLDTTTNQPNDIPVDCAAPHAMEVTGAVNLGARFPGDGVPLETDQDLFIKDECTRLTDEYLAPLQLRTTTLTLIYSTISLPSWSAGSRQVACSIGATLGNGGWAALMNGAKGPLLINGQPPIPPPDIPEERLNLPAIPVPMMPSEQPTYEPDYSAQEDTTQHGPTATQTPTATETTAPPAQGNTFIGGPPPPPVAPEQVPPPAPGAEVVVPAPEAAPPPPADVPPPGPVEPAPVIPVP